MLSVVAAKSAFLRVCLLLLTRTAGGALVAALIVIDVSSITGTGIIDVLSGLAGKSILMGLVGTIVRGPHHGSGSAVLQPGLQVVDERPSAHSRQLVAPQSREVRGFEVAAEVRHEERRGGVEQVVEVPAGHVQGDVAQVLVRQVALAALLALLLVAVAHSLCRHALVDQPRRGHRVNGQGV